MSSNDQADGFYTEPSFCRKCGPAIECCCTIKSRSQLTAKGLAPQMDVANFTTGRIPFRLAMGFAMWKASER